VNTVTDTSDLADFAFDAKLVSFFLTVAERVALPLAK
jgi:hypothetical protein